jgi:L-iditol 2-dehydrogenase
VSGCLESLRPMGRHVQVAICGRDIPFAIDRVFYKQLSVAGSVCYTARTWERMFEMFSEARIALADLVSHKLPITDWRAAFDLVLNRQSLKVLLYPV